MKSVAVRRLLKPPHRSFFLLGPRGTGKSTWLKSVFPKAIHLDLLDASLALELARDPHRLEALIEGKGPARWIILDEVHRLMEIRPWSFALCGSSARKLKRGGRRSLSGPSAHDEYGSVFPQRTGAAV